MSRILAVVSPALIVLSNFAIANQRTWEGTWNNRKYGTRGPLQCVATEKRDGQWEATFTGKFRGDPFRYTATFQSSPARRGLQLQGNNTVRGHQYQWTGTLDARQLKGQYRNNVGYNGQFILNEVGRQPQSRTGPMDAPTFRSAPDMEMKSEQWSPLIKDGDHSNIPSLEQDCIGSKSMCVTLCPATIGVLQRAHLLDGPHAFDSHLNR